MKWDNATVPMRDLSQLRDNNIDDFEDEIFSMHDLTTTDAARIQEIMDVKYAPAADINERVSECDHLTDTARRNLKMLLHKFKSLFDGTLGTWDDTEPIDLELKDPETQPYHARPYPCPTQVTFDRGSEFIGHEFKKMLNDYGVKTKPITTRNPQANAIVERVH
jgi:hypothetical protein